MGPKQNSPNQLQVEGSDDRWAIINLMMRHGHDWDAADTGLPYVKDMLGKDPLLAAIPVSLKSPFDCLGFVLDADANIAQRWAQVRAGFNGTPWPLPKVPAQGGTILTNGSQRVGVWLMPDNQDAGTLEDLLATLVPHGDTSIDYARHVARYAREHKAAPCREVDHAKSTLHTWLAWRETPGMPYGTAITATVLRHDSEIALEFVAWMRGLFELAPA